MTQGVKNNIHIRRICLFQIISPICSSEKLFAALCSTVIHYPEMSASALHCIALY